MAKAKVKDEATSDEPLPGEFGPIYYSDWLKLPEEVKERRRKRAYERFMALKGKIHIELDIDEARGRNRR